MGERGRRGLATALLLSASFGCASGRRKPIEDPPELRTLGSVHTLPNGLRVVVGHDRRQTVATVSWVVGAGSAEDPPGKAGLAHLVEHLTYRARARPDGPARDLVLESLGGEYQADASLDFTAFHAFAFHGFWKELVAIEAGRLADPLGDLDPALFRGELDVVRAEQSQHEETNGSAQGLGRLQEKLFASGDPYGHAIGGTQESLRALTLEDAKAFARRYYRPVNATFYIDVGAAAVGEAEIDPLLASLANPTPVAGESSRPSPPPAPPSEPLSVEHRSAPVVSPELWVGWVLPSVFSTDGALVNLMAALARVQLSTERLYADAPGVASIDVSLQRGRRATLLSCRAILLPGADAAAVARTIADHVSTLWASQLPEMATLDQRRNILRNTKLFGEATLRTRAATRPLYAHFTGDAAFPVHSLATSMEAFDEYVAGDVFRQYLSPNRARAVSLEPAAVGRAPEHSVEAPAAAETPPAPPGPFPSIPATPIGPAGGALLTEVLDNGLTAIVAPLEGVSGATILIGFHGGTADQTPRGVPEVERSAGVFSMADFSCGSLAQCGILWLTPEVERDGTLQAWITDSTLAKHTLEIVGEAQYVSWMEWPHGERAERFRAERRLHFGRIDLSTLEGLVEGLYPTRGFGSPASPTELDAIDAKTAMAWSESHRAARNAAVIVVGDVDGNETLGAIKEAFGSWKTGSPSPTPVAPAFIRHPRPPVTMRPWPGSPQAEISLGCRVPPGDGVVQEILAHHLARELDRTLRRAAGVTYGFLPRATLLRGGAADLTVTGYVANAAVPQVVRRMEDLVDDLGRGSWPGSPPDGSAVKVPDQEALSYVTRRALTIDNSTSIAGSLFHRWNVGLPLAETLAPTDLGQRGGGTALEDILRTCKDTAAISIAAAPSALSAGLSGAPPP